jgi:hypothetical protein
MFLVAFVGLGLWVRDCCERRADYLHEAGNHTAEAKALLDHISMIEGGNWWGGCIVWNGPEPGQDPKVYCAELARNVRREISWHLQLAEGFRYHANHPWKRVPTFWVGARFPQALE